MPAKLQLVREVLSTAQLGFLWKLYFPFDGTWGTLTGTEFLEFLARTITFPGIKSEATSYMAGGVERHVVENVQRGGEVSVDFVENELGTVDRYFRNWVTLKVDNGAAWSSRAINPKDTYTKTATANLYSRMGTLTASYRFLNLVPLNIGPYSLSYETPLHMIKVQMVCDMVDRIF